MPWKLILFLLCLVITVFFIGFNLDNSCNINLGFRTYENVPVFLTVLISFIAGAMLSFVFMVGVKLSSTDKKTKAQKEQKLQKVSAKKEPVVNLSTPASEKTEATTKKPSLIEKGRGMLSKKKNEAKNEKKDAGVQTIVLDDDQSKK